MENQNSGFNASLLLKSLSTRSGVYRMIGAEGEILYVGKARNLKARVSSYFYRDNSVKIRSLVSQICNIEFTITQSESEALLLECNLIKEYKPRYNVTFRDDKSYPYIYVSDQNVYPALKFHRGVRSGKGQYYGPYPNAYAVRDTLNLLQKLFRVRQCDEAYFKNRTRPCLQYQIHRCTAPCVGYITEEEYRQDVEHAVFFLQGKTGAVVDHLVKRMDAAAEALQYEQAARYRDQIRDLHKIQEHQFITGAQKNIDVIAIAQQSGLGCVQVFYIRNGRNLGNKAFFLRAPDETDIIETLSAFVSQYYLNREIPDLILIDRPLIDQELLSSALSQNAERNVKISVDRSKKRNQWLETARTNAEQALKLRLAGRESIVQKLESLQDLLQLEKMPERIECFDVSHTQGEATVASCVVLDGNGFLKSDYRRFNINDITAGDDYSAMRQALERRYSRLIKGEGKLPDVLLIDGGKGQVSQALDVLHVLQTDSVIVVGVAKGPERIPGRETLIVPHLDGTLNPPADFPGFLLIQNIRDEAHRFAIDGHRGQRAKKRHQSLLDTIPGLGPKRRQQLLKHYGGLQGIYSANVDELAKVPNISERLAQIIYDSLHSD